MQALQKFPRIIFFKFAPYIFVIKTSTNTIALWKTFKGTIYHSHIWALWVPQGGVQKWGLFYWHDHSQTDILKSMWLSISNFLIKVKIFERQMVQSKLILFFIFFGLVLFIFRWLFFLKNKKDVSQYLTSLPKKLWSPYTCHNDSI